MLTIFVTVRDLDMNRAPEEEEWMMGSMEEDEEISNNNNGGGHPRKKLRLTKEQSHLLEQTFRQNHTLNPVHFSKFSLFFFFSFFHFLFSQKAWFRKDFFIFFYLICRNRRKLWRKCWNWSHGKLRFGFRTDGPGG